MKKAVTIMIVIFGLTSGCNEPVRSKLLRASPDELTKYTTQDLIKASKQDLSFLNLKFDHYYGPEDTWVFDPEIDQELIKRQKEDIELLIKKATSIKDFETTLNGTLAHQICNKYKNTPAFAIDISSKFWSWNPKLVSVSAKWIEHGFDYNKDVSIFAIARKQWYIKNHPNLALEIRESILGSRSAYQHKLILGMKALEVIVAIGYPNDINHTVGSWGTHEQWVYGDFGPCFYFDNEILTSWQD